MVKTSMLLSLFFFLGALLGAFAGYQLGSSPRLDPPGSELSRAEPRQAAPPEKLPDAVRAPSRPREAAGAARAERAEAYHRVEETLREIPTPPAARGSARISGRVLGEDETPLGGVVVRATAVRDDPGRESAAAWNPDGVSRAAAVLDLIVAYDWERATTRTAETDASGSYVLENLLAEQRYTLEARKEGWKARPAPGQPSEDVKPGGNLDFVAERVVKIPVQLSLEDGETPHRGRIDWKKGRRQGSESWRAQDAAVELRPGTYRLTARSGEHNEYASEEQEVEVTATETPAALTFVLRPRPGIRGRLLFPPGEQPSGTLVHALHYAGEEPPAPEQLPTSGSRAWARERDGYRFTFHDLEEGAYLVGASRGSEVVATQVVRVTDGLAEAEIAIPSLARDEYVVVLVYGPGGEILKDANISGCGDVIRRPDGSAWIIPDPRRTRGDSCQIYVSSARYGSQRAQVSLPNDEEVAIHFEEPAHLDVAIAGYRGSGLEGRLSLKLRPATTGSRSGYVGRGGGVGYAGYPGFAGTSRSRGLDAEGRQSFGPVVPGDYTLQLTLRAGSRSYERVLERQPVSIGSGDNRASLSVPPLYEVTVQVVGAEPGQQIQLRPRSSRGSWWSDTQRVASGGKLTFESVPAGEYSLSTRDNSLSGTLTIQVPSGAMPTFELQRLDAFKVSVGKEGYLKAVGFRSGDLIIGADGVEFARTTELSELIARGANKTAALLVQRGEEVLEIVVELGKLKDHRQMGGYYRPVSR